MQIGICTGLDDAAALKDAGVEYLEVNVQGFLKPQEDDDAFAPNLEAAKNCPLPISAANCFLPGSLRSTGEKMNLEGIKAYAEVAFKRAAQVGIEHIVFGSGGSRGLEDPTLIEEASGQFVVVLQALGPIAAAHDVVVVVEPLNSGECNFINSLADGAAVVRAADHPNIRLLADFFHMLRDGESPEQINEHGSLLAHCHLAEKEKRTCPGVAGDDFRPFFKALKQVGYNGKISMEASFPDGMTNQAASAIAAMREHMVDAGW